MSTTTPDEDSNPFRPPEVDLAGPSQDERALFLMYREACLGHEIFQRCVGLADILCSAMGTLFVIGSLGILIYMWQHDTVTPSFQMLFWVLGRFVFLPALIALLVALGINLARRRLWAWRAQILLSGVVVVFAAASWWRYRSPNTAIWFTVYFWITVAAHAAVVGVFISKRGFRIIAPRYAAIVAATPSLSGNLDTRTIVSAIALAAALALGMLSLALWLSWQAAVVFHQFGGP
jgi:hypothetical protein